LDADPSLWCVSAWNDNGAKPHAADQSLLLRTSYFPGLGWMLRRKDWEDLATRWPENPTTGWDHWIRRPANVGGRSCVFPEVPRTRHLASVGTNVQAAEQRRYDALALASAPDSAYDSAPSVFGDVSYVLRGAYSAAVAAILKESPRASTRSLIRGGGSGGAGPVVVLAPREEYAGVAKSLGLVVGEPRGGEDGVLFARRPTTSSRTGSDTGSSTGKSGVAGAGGKPRLWAADRVLVVDPRAAASLLSDAEAWSPHPEASTAAAAKGQSCTDKCRRVGKRCIDRELAWANDCAALMQHFPCEKGCGHQIGDEIPAYVADPSAATHGQCLTTEQRLPRCGASHRSTARLCVCVPF